MALLQSPRGPNFLVRRALPLVFLSTLGLVACGDSDTPPPQIAQCTPGEADGQLATLGHYSSSSGGVSHGPSPNFTDAGPYRETTDPEILAAFADWANGIVEDAEDDFQPSRDYRHLKLDSHISDLVCATDDNLLHLTPDADEVAERIARSDYASNLGALHNLEKPEVVVEDPRAAVTHYSVENS